MHDRVRIRALSDAGHGPTAIARLVGCSRATVYRAIAPGSATSYFRAPRYADAIPRVEEVLAAYPAMPAPAVAVQASWPGSLRQLYAVIQPMRSDALRRAIAQGITIRPLPTLAAWHEETSMQVPDTLAELAVPIDDVHPYEHNPRRGDHDLRPHPTSTSLK